MLRRITVESFRSIEHVELEIPEGPSQERLAVLVGPNGAGKSNVLDAVLFVRDLLVHGSAAFRGERRGALRPGSTIAPEDLCWKGKPSAEPMGVSLELDAPVDACPTLGTYTLVVGPDGKVDREALTITNPAGGEVTVLEANRATGGRALDAQDQSVPLGRMALPPALSRCNVAETFPSIAPFFNEITSIRGHALVPALMRGEPLVDEAQPLWPRGDNLSAVLLSLKTEHERVFGELLEYLCQHVPEVRSLKTPVLEAQHTQLTTYEKGLTKPIAASLSSDGVLKLLGLLIVALQPFPAPCVVIEEPEAHLHLGLMPLVADLLRFLGRRSAVLVATHSPRLLGALEPGHVVVVEKVDGATTLRPLSTHTNDLGAALDEMDLGEAWMNGFFGGLPNIGGAGS